MKSRFVKLCGLVAWVFFITLTGCGRSASDDELEKLFRNHQKEFIELKNRSAQVGVIEMITPKLIRADTELIELNGRLPSDLPNNTQSKLSAEEWRSYFSLMDSLSVAMVFREATDSDVTFKIQRESFLNGDSQKGIAYMESSPSPVVPDLDSYKPTSTDSHGSFTVYKHIFGHWYLYFGR